MRGRCAFDPTLRTFPLWGVGSEGQMRKALVSCGPMLVLIASGAMGDETDGRFRPEAHFPSPALAFVRVSDCGTAREELRETFLGRFLGHPGTERALRGLTSVLEERARPFTETMREITGKEPRELWNLLGGEVALLVRGVQPSGMPELAIAIESGEHRDEILGILGRIRTYSEVRLGSPVEERRVGAVDAWVWTTPRGLLFQAELGSHFLLVTSQDLLRVIAAAFAGAEGAMPYSSSTLHRELSGPLNIDVPGLRAEFNLEALIGLMVPLAAAGQNPMEVLRFVQATGIRRWTSFGFAAGLKEGRLRYAVHLGTREGPEGVFGALQQGFAPLGPIDAAAANVPADVHCFGGARVAVGTTLQRLDRVIRTHVPELEETLTQLDKELESETGISVERDVFSLGDLAVYAFEIAPPAGSLFRDRLCLVRTEEFLPYWSLFEKIGAAVGASTQTIETSRGHVEFVNLAQSSTYGKILDRIDAPEDDVALSETQAMLIATSLLVPYMTLARSERADGWTVVSTLSQAVVRHVRHYSGRRKLSEDQRLVELGRRVLPDASLGMVFVSGETTVWLYNTALHFAGDLSPLLAQLGVEPAWLPTGEELEVKRGPGHVRLVSNASGLTLAGYGVSELVGGAMIAALTLSIVPAIIDPSVAPTEREPVGPPARIERSTSKTGEEPGSEKN